MLIQIILIYPGPFETDLALPFGLSQKGLDVGKDLNHLLQHETLEETTRSCIFRVGRIFHGQIDETRIVPSRLQFTIHSIFTKNGQKCLYF